MNAPVVQADLATAINQEHERAFGKAREALEPVRRFLRRLDPEAEAFTFQTFDDTAEKRPKLARIMHGDLDGVIDELDALQRQRAGVFVTVNATDGKGRQSHNVVRVRGVFVDLDGAPLGPVLEAGIDPHIVCESSPGRFHAYWLTDDCPLDQFERVQRALAQRFNGDPSVHDLPRVMRLPGFRHFKGNAQMCKMLDGIGTNAPPYPLAEIIKALRLDLNAPEEKPQAKPNGDGGKIAPGNRHGHLFASGRSMALKGLSREAVRAALAAENQARCDPPLPAADMDYLAERAFTAKDAQGWQGGAVPGADAPQTHTWPPPLDLAALATREPEAPRHIIGDWLPAGEVTLLAGHGGGGKSQIVLYLAVCVALGRPWCGMPTERRPVTYISAEDGADVIHWRLARVAAYLGVTLADLSGLRIIDASRIDAELMAEIPHEEPILTAMYVALGEQIDPGGVLILDGASDLYGASEITRRHVRRYVRALRRLVNADGAVLLLAHVDKAAVRDSGATDRYSGSTAWHNSVRARWSLTTDADSDALVLALAKANHARAGAEIKLRWDEHGHLYVPDPVAADGGIVGAIRDRTERDGILAAMRACAEPIPAATSGQRTGWHVLSARPELPDSMRSGRDGRRRFWARIEELRQMGAISESSYRRSNRHILATLTVAAEGRAECAE